METKNMQYWKARNMIPGIDQDSEGNTDLPDGKSGSSPLQERKTSWKNKIKAAWQGTKAALTAHDQFLQSGAHAYRQAKKKYRKQQ